MELKIGDKVNYGVFSNLLFKGEEDCHILFTDENGNEKKFLKKLFFKINKMKE